MVAIKIMNIEQLSGWLQIKNDKQRAAVREVAHERSYIEQLLVWLQLQTVGRPEDHHRRTSPNRRWYIESV
jgi:hypothetical protein